MSNLTATRSRKRTKPSPQAEAAPAVWPGTVWDGLIDENMSRTPDALLVSDRDDIDAPIALIRVQTYGDAQQQVERYHHLLDIAVEIARRPEALDKITDIPVTDLRATGRLDSRDRPPQDLSDMSFAQWGIGSDDVYRCEPFSRFTLAHQLARMAGLAGVKDRKQAVVRFGDDGREVEFRIDLDSANIEAVAK